MANKERDFLDVTSLQRTAPPAPGAKRPAKLAIKTWNNKVSMSVFTSLENLPRYGIIGVNLYPVQFYSILASMRRVLNKSFNNEPFGESTILFDKGTKDKKEIGRISYGYDKSGIFQLAVTVPDNQYPKITFQFKPLYNSEVTADQQDASRDETNGWITFWEQIMPIYLLNNFVDESKTGGYGNNNNRGGNYGGYNNNNSNSYQNVGSTETTDEIPWA